MKKIGLICIMFTALTTFGVRAEEGNISERYRCFYQPYWIELTRLTAAGKTQGSGQMSFYGVTYPALFRITRFGALRWDFGKERNYDFITIESDGKARHFRSSTRIADRVFDCELLSRSLLPAELPQWDSPQRQPRREKDPQKRPGRKRTADGWVYELE